MNPLALAQSAVSLLVLVLGLYAWKLTSSRSVAFNAVFGSAAMLFAAYLVQTGREPQLTVTMPVVAFALYAGRAIGFGIRSRKEPELRAPAVVLGIASAMPLVSAVFAYLRLK